jgi:O2-independent ubiquinone biosynthesis accessory factor UbiT
VLPFLAALGLRFVPQPLLQLPLQRVIAAFARRHPAVFGRLGPQASKRFLIDPTDLPFAFRLCPKPPSPRIEVLAKTQRPLRQRPWDARIAGPLAALLGMVHGTLDGDALFFSRELVIEGDTEAVLALRNALDDAEIDLVAEAAAAFPPLGPAVEPAVRGFLAAVSRHSGVALTRRDA